MNSTMKTMLGLPALVTRCCLRRDVACQSMKKTILNEDCSVDCDLRQGSTSAAIEVNSCGLRSAIPLSLTKSDINAVNDKNNR